MCVCERERERVLRRSQIELQGTINKTRKKREKELSSPGNSQ